MDTVAEELKERLIAELGFRVDPNEKRSLIKDISENYGMVFYHDEEYPLSFGFYHYNGKNFAPAQKTRLKTNVMTRWEFSEYFDDFYDDLGDNWICRRFKGNNRQGWTNTDMVSYLLRAYQRLELTVRILDIK
ncbi:MAG: hypothetical protein LBQ57_04485 [Spirochaetales bacterium]|jgi:hypothetical protein|nr:hypothetical protein [Spirochaetales bacterium]